MTAPVPIVAMNTAAAPTLTSFNAATTMVVATAPHAAGGQMVAGAAGHPGCHAI